jgi:hypothetical protein
MAKVRAADKYIETTSPSAGESNHYLNRRWSFPFRCRSSRGDGFTKPFSRKGAKAQSNFTRRFCVS